MMTVKQRADVLGTFRYVEVRLMEMVAYWTPITPEMEIKVMFGRHIWDFAQHADWLGKRTFELRQPEQYTRTAADDYVALLDQMKRTRDTAEKLTLLYDVVLPGLIHRYQEYLAGTDPILDGPSVLIIERILLELRRQIENSQKLRRELAVGMPDVQQFRARESVIGSIVAP